jgi:hypothetical protein
MEGRVACLFDGEAAVWDKRVRNKFLPENRRPINDINKGKEMM